MKILYFIIFLTFPLICLSQSNYKKGYIIGVKGDTTHGYINYQEREQNPKNITFKKDASTARSQVMGYASISGFGIEGFEYFKRAIVRISLNRVDVQNVATNIDTSSKTDTVFLKVLQKGKPLTLYAYTDIIKTRFYISDSDTQVPEELIYIIYADAGSTQGRLVTKKTYCGQLIVEAEKYHAHSTNLTDRINNANYEQPDLIAITAAINGDNLVKKKNNAIRFFAGIGVNSSSLKYDGVIDLAQKATFSTSVNPKISVGMDIYNKREIGRLILRIEFSVSKYNYNVTATGGLDKEVQQVNQFTTSITPQVIYNFYNTPLLKVYLDAGIAANLSYYQTNSTTITGSLFLNQTVMNNDPELESFWVLFPIKLGVVLNKRIEIYGGWSPSATLYATSGSSGYVSYATAGINYLFGK